MTILECPGLAGPRGSLAWLQAQRQDSGAVVCVPRLRYYLARGQTAQERRQVTRLLCLEVVYVQEVGRWTAEELRPDLN